MKHRPQYETVMLLCSQRMYILTKAVCNMWHHSHFTFNIIIHGFVFPCLWAPWIYTRIRRDDHRTQHKRITLKEKESPNCTFLVLSRFLHTNLLRDTRDAPANPSDQKNTMPRFRGLLFSGEDLILLPLDSPMPVLHSLVQQGHLLSLSNSCLV